MECTENVIKAHRSCRLQCQRRAAFWLRWSGEVENKDWFNSLQKYTGTISIRVNELTFTSDLFQFSPSWCLVSAQWAQWGTERDTVIKGDHTTTLTICHTESPCLVLSQDFIEGMARPQMTTHQEESPLRSLLSTSAYTPSEFPPLCTSLSLESAMDSRFLQVRGSTFYSPVQPRMWQGLTNCLL